MAMGVIHDNPKPSYEVELLGQDARARLGKNTKLAKLLAKGQARVVGA
jgi:2-oxoglutarate ferredoxin oxidoreductase subunit beta